MAIVINEITEKHLDITEDGVNMIAPRKFLNKHYQQLIGGNIEDVDRDGIKYKAFPFTQIIGVYLVLIYSDGDAHASSDRQIMARKPIASIASNTVPWETVVFFENSTGDFDFSLLSDIMNNGDLFTFKVWAVSQTSGIISAATATNPVVSGNPDPEIDGTYLLWSKPRTFAGSVYRTCYSVEASGWNTALFTSADQVTWTLKGVIAKGRGAALQFNETDIVETTSGNFLAFIREDAGAGRAVYTSTSADLITWTAPVLSTIFTGTQPNAIELTNGSLLVSFGDRVGSTGFDAGGVVLNGDNLTGIITHVSTDNGATWSLGTNFDLSWSTDCGQPYMEEVSAGIVSMCYYNSWGPTSESFTEPGISQKVFSEANIV